MAGADCAFFYTARLIGVNKVVVSLATYPQLEWRGRQAVLAADAEQEALRLYAMDLLWMLVRAKYKGEFPQPSKLVKRETVPKGPETAQEIIDHMIKKLTKLSESGATIHRMKGDEIIHGSNDLGSARNA